MLKLLSRTEPSVVPVYNKPQRVLLRDGTYAIVETWDDMMTLIHHDDLANKRPTERLFPQLKDATERYDFSVGRIPGSITEDLQHCAASCAIKEHPDVVNCWTMGSRAYILFTDFRMLRYEVPKHIQRRIQNFDDSNGVFGFPPGDYYFLPPCSIHRSGADHGRKRNANGTRPHLSNDRAIRHVGKTKTRRRQRGSV